MVDLVPELGWIIPALIIGTWVLSRTIGLPWLGRVTHFADGDSLESKAWTRIYGVRIRGLDAPEYTQDYGRTARRALVDLIGERRVLFVPFGADRRGRLLCWAFCHRGPINWIMVWRGHAWSGSLATWIIHIVPRMLRRGLWAADVRIRPDGWRRYGARMSAHLGRSSTGNLGSRSRKSPNAKGYGGTTRTIPWRPD